MLQRPLGHTGFNVSRLGYGSMGLRGPNTWGTRVVADADAETILNAVLDAGINFIDTSPDYGLSEERIGRFISQRREEFFLATKCGCDPVQHPNHLEIRHTWTRDTIKRNVETSLRRLKTDHIDLLQLHGGTADEIEQNGLWELLEQYQHRGVIRHIGISSSVPELPIHIRRADYASYQMPYSCLTPDHEPFLKQAAEQGAGVIIRGGIARGGPEAEIQRPEVNDVWTKARLNELVTDGMTPAQLILRHTLTHPSVDTVIVGTCSLKHLTENVAACHQGPLPPDIYREIQRRVQDAVGPR